MSQLDLLDWIDRYPFVAGAKSGSTSRQAADRIEASGRAENLRQQCLKALQCGGMTGKELAAELGVEVTSCRPRLSELKARGLIEESGLRRNGQHVYRIRTNH